MSNKLTIEAFEASQTIDLRTAFAGLGKHYPVVWNDSLMVTLSAKRQQYLILTHYGAVALANTSPQFRIKALSLIEPFLRNSLPSISTEDSIKVFVEPNEKICVLFNKIIIPSFEEKFLLIIGMLLCQSVGLESYEKRIDPLLDQLFKEMRKFEKPLFWFRTTHLKRLINQLMRLHQELITNLGILDKPELTWENQDFDFLYTNFADSLELSERSRVLSEKFKLMQLNTKTSLDLIATVRLEILEIAIIILIALSLIPLL
jgi:uncharacterized Rmd1/YagE family protein